MNTDLLSTTSLDFL